MDSQFNAIDYAQQLAAAGIPQAQADVHAKALSQALSTCAASKADLAGLDQKLTARMDLFEARVIGRIEAFEAKVERQLAVMGAELKHFRRLINLVLAMQVALLVKMFIP
jgi:hypothetical protein